MAAAPARLFALRLFGGSFHIRFPAPGLALTEALVGPAVPGPR